MNGWAARLPMVLAPLGGALVVLAERVWPGTAAAPYLAALGALLLLVALALNLPPLQSRQAAPWLAAPYGAFVLALACYYAGRALPLPVTPPPVDWAALARAGWMLALAAGAVLFPFGVLARLAERGSPQRDLRRLRIAGSAGLSLALLVLLVLLLDFAFAHLPWQWNLAYFKTTQPSAATHEVVQGLQVPVQVAVFYPVDSEVRPLLQSYFQALQGQAGSEPLQVQFLDADLQPAQAAAFKARGNGWVVLKREALDRAIRVGATLEQARGQLRTFDRHFLMRLLEVSRQPTVVYLTVGHGERNENGGRRETGEGLLRFNRILRDRNYTVKSLGVTDYVNGNVPEDAGLVAIVAPARPFLNAEADALRAYLNGGGRLLVYLEPHLAGARPAQGGPGVSIEALLKPYGVAYDPVVQANDRVFARHTYSKADRALLVTVAYQGHPSVNDLRRRPTEHPLLLQRSGALRIDKPPPTVTVTETIRAMPSTWGDVNGDYEFEAATERRGQPALALAVSPVARPAGAKPADAKAPPQTGPTMLIFADADMVGDLLIQNRTNQQVLADALGWLVKAEAPVGLPETEEDVRIQHLKGDDWLWFYLPVLGVPALVLLIGFLRVGRRRRRGGRHG